MSIEIFSCDYLEYNQLIGVCTGYALILGDTLTKFQFIILTGDNTI